MGIPKIVWVANKARRAVEFRTETRKGPTEVSELLKSLDNALLMDQARRSTGDKAYDSDDTRALGFPRHYSHDAVPKANRKVSTPNDIDSTRAVTPCVVTKQFRGIATRYGKLATAFESLREFLVWQLSSQAPTRNSEDRRLCRAMGSWGY